jgi:branched-chain amino acid transport system ATP-binding protein
VIGPNGAGKSTLTNLLSGDLPPTSGRIELAGQDITRAAPEQISRHGLGRSYQKTNIFAPFTVWENVRLAAQSRAPQQPWRCAGGATRRRPCRQRARRGRAGARGPGRAPPHHRWRRQPRRAAPARVAMTLATEPRVLLLDEPLAGMGAAEAERMVELLLRLKPRHAMMLVEHDMDAVFTLADRLTVMVNGTVIASGEPAAIRADRGVQAAYLGEDH